MPLLLSYQHPIWSEWQNQRERWSGAKRRGERRGVYRTGVRALEQKNFSRLLLKQTGDRTLRKFQKNGRYFGGVKSLQSSKLRAWNYYKIGVKVKVTAFCGHRMTRLTHVRYIRKRKKTETNSNNGLIIKQNITCCFVAIKMMFLPSFW